MAAIIMSWGKCTITFGVTAALDAISATLTSPGKVKDGTTVLSTEDGEKYVAKETGGATVAMAEGEKTLKLTTRIMEPELSVVAALLGGTVTAGNLPLSTMVVSVPYSVVVEPKNIGGKGIKIRKAHLSYTEGYNDKEGSFADLTFTVIKCDDGEMYQKYTKTA